MDASTSVVSRHGRASAHVVRFLLLLALLGAAAGCASMPPYRTRPELPQERAGIRAVGVLPPAIEMFQERARFGLNNTVPQAEWSLAANEAVAKAFADEMAADHVSVVPIGSDDIEARDFAELYSAVDFSILRHAFEKNTGEMLTREPFEEQVRSFDYSLGPAAELMDRYHVDAVWIARGFNLVPTPGARAMHGLDITLTILSALGGVPLPGFQLERLQLRVALIDRSGRVLYYGVADSGSAPPATEPPVESAPTDMMSPSAVTEEATSVDDDLRDARAARLYLQAALSEYRAKGAP